MEAIILGVGGFGATGSASSGLRTFGLGSCVAVMAYDLTTRIAGMVHVALPDSSANAARAKLMPGYFADTGVDELMLALSNQGARVKSNNSLIVTLAGGASIMKGSFSFNIGQRNVDAVRAQLMRYRLTPSAEDVGGSISRTVSIEAATGKVCISSPGRREWTL